MVKYLSEAFKFVNNNLIDSLRLSTRPDCINGDTVEILKNYKVEPVEIGAQTFNDRLLKILNRGHTV